MSYKENPNFKDNYFIVIKLVFLHKIILTLIINCFKIKVRKDIVCDLHYVRL